MFFNESEVVVTKIDTVVTVPGPGEGSPLCYYERSRHSHGLVFKLTGRTEYDCAGRRIAHVPNTILYLAPDQPYRFAATGDCIAVNFHLASPCAGASAVFAPANPEAYRRLFVRMDRAWLARGVGFDAECRSILYHIIAQLARHQLESDRYAGAILLHIRPSVEYIHRHLGDTELSVAAAAQAGGISCAYLRRLFKQSYQTSPVQYIQQLRMNRAADLLRERALSVSAVSAACGYKTVYQFSNAFLKIMGARPSAYASQVEGGGKERAT